jgi:hypothetical protein
MENVILPDLLSENLFHVPEDIFTDSEKVTVMIL